MSAESKAAEDAPPKKGGKKRILLIAAPVLLLLGGAGLWFAGLVPGLGKTPEPSAAEAPPPPPPGLVELPEIVTNLNVPGRRPTYLRLRAKLEIARADEAAAVQAAMPRLMDLFQTYLREVRPEELRGSAGTHRLREELVARASLATAPARVTDVLFLEMLVQ